MFDYSGTKWKVKRLHVLRLDGYKDRVAAMYGRTLEATIVHHIYPAEEYPEYSWCDWNLISVSMATHNKLENRTTGELTKMGCELMERTVPGMDWRKKKKIVPPSL
ncbi:MAG TPA: hypothetical protein DEQ64_08970 [Lachnoclostridium sp.]|nr:hypothetical protein [Lachnoclostridium sp.]